MHNDDDVALATLQREDFIRYRMGGDSVQTAAAKAGISRASGYRWERERMLGSPTRPWARGRTGAPPLFVQRCWGYCPTCGVALEKHAERFESVEDWSVVSENRFYCEAHRPGPPCPTPGCGTKMLDGHPGEPWLCTKCGTTLKVAAR